MKLALIYSLLALVATAANIGAQDIVTRLYVGPFALTLAMVAGTGTGLVVKYALDKKYIFSFRAQGVLHDGRTFALYTATGVFTTLIFWGFEFGFELAFRDRVMRYAGAVIGLAIGYVIKYRLDRRFVFRRELA
jgi:putative flippase GtrA